MFSRVCCAAIVLPALGLLTAAARAQPHFVPATDAHGLSAIHTPDSDFIGVEWWQTGGMALGDFNRDGWTDVFWLSGGSIPDKLFINDGKGHFTDQAFAWGLTALHCGVGASVADYDDDGWLDIYVTSWGPTAGSAGPGQHRLYHNEGGTSFTEVAAAAGVSYSSSTLGGGYGSAWGDYDLDGDLDLFVAHWQVFAAGNRLYRNNGDGTFTNVTASLLPSLAGVWGFQPAFADMNGDGYPELLLSADFESSRYFINQGGVFFIDGTVPAGLGLDDNGMGNTVADFDRDGNLDWYVTSIHKDMPQPGDNVGNMLYMNQRPDVFLEQSVAAGCNNGGWGWGTTGGDLDNDGWVDIIEVNGRPGGGEWQNEPSKLFYNLTGGGGPVSFAEMAIPFGFIHVAEGTSATCFDADHDGDLDILAFANSGPLAFYENQTVNPGAWLEVALDTSAHPLIAPDGFGARLTATVGAVDFVRYQDGRPNYLGTGDHVVHFGLGGAPVVDQLRIDWPRGYVTVLEDVAVDQLIVVSAPPYPDFDDDGHVTFADLLILLAAWGPCDPPPAPCPADLNQDGAVGFADILLLLAEWG